MRSMKTMMNITTCQEDLLRYKSNEDLRSFYQSYGLDGLEVLEAGADRWGILTPTDTVGVHLRYYSSWMDLWTDDRRRLLEEFGGWEACRQAYGGDTREALLEAYRGNIRFANTLEPEYLVFHVSECTMAESMLREYHYSDEEVVDAVIALIDQVSGGIQGTPWLLFENLWYSGMNMLRPEIVGRLLDGIHYPKAGIMLDLGHLMHTNMELQSPQEAVDYFHRVLDRLGDLSAIKGVHLHQSLSGAYAKKLRETWRPAEGSYMERTGEVMGHIFTIDTHRPFESPRIWEVLDRLPLEYLVLEEISADREEHARQLSRQVSVLRRA